MNTFSVMLRAATDALNLVEELVGDQEQWETDAIFDAFWYPGEEVWHEYTCPRDIVATLPAPCPAHTDPGLLTLIFDDLAALEVLQSDGSWSLVSRRQGEALLVAGRQLVARSHGVVPACVHRVRPTVESRTSLVFELRASNASSLMASKAVLYAAAPMTAGPQVECEWEAERKYARAASVLCARAASHTDGRHSSCRLM